MPSPKKPFRLNVGFIIHEEIGNNYDFPFEFAKVKLGDDLELRNFEGIINVGKTPQGLVVQADFSAETTLECVRCLTQFEHELDWSFTELYAFDKRSETESEELILPEDAHIDAAEILREYALLEIPISPICKADCQGLCTECGQNLNEKDCGHRPEENDSPFAKLKDLLK
ncbi:MAG: YceD family protein [Anaerolineales bacterium]